MLTGFFSVKIKTPTETDSDPWMDLAEEKKIKGETSLEHTIGNS